MLQVLIMLVSRALLSARRLLHCPCRMIGPINFKSPSLSRNRATSIRKGRILGIETSCDDTGVAVVDTEGAILGESLFSQQELHLE